MNPEANHVAALASLVQDRMRGAFDDVSASGAALLLTLLNRGELTVTALADILGVAQSTATRLIDGQQRLGLVRRAGKAGREVRVALTAKGRRRADGLQRARADAAAALLAPLTAAERRTLGGLVDKLLYHATQSRAFARHTCRFCDHHVCRGRRCPINRRATELEKADGAPTGKGRDT